MIWFADFETCKKSETEAGVYLGYIEKLDDSTSCYFLNIEQLFKFIGSQKTKQTHTVFFHNLTWDAEFIVWWLIKNGFKPQMSKIDKANEFKEKIDYLGNKSIFD